MCRKPMRTTVNARQYHDKKYGAAMMIFCLFTVTLTIWSTQWFPVEYPNSWYHDITTDTERYMTLAAVQDDTIIGLVVSEVISN